MVRQVFSQTELNAIRNKEYKEGQNKINEKLKKILKRKINKLFNRRPLGMEHLPKQKLLYFGRALLRDVAKDMKIELEESE